MYTHTYRNRYLQHKPHTLHPAPPNLQGKFKKIFDDNGYKMWVAIYIATNVILASYVYFSRKGWLDGSSPQVCSAFSNLKYVYVCS